MHCLRNSKNNTERKMSSLWLGIIHTSIKWLRLNHVLVLLRGRRLAETQKLRVRLLCCAVVHHVVLIHVWLAAVSSSTTSCCCLSASYALLCCEARVEERHDACLRDYHALAHGPPFGCDFDTTDMRAVN